MCFQGNESGKLSYFVQEVNNMEKAERPGLIKDHGLSFSLQVSGFTQDLDAFAKI